MEDTGSQCKKKMLATEESGVWIRFIIRAELLPGQKMGDLEDEATQLCNIIGKSIVTAKQNADKHK